MYRFTIKTMLVMLCLVLVSCGDAQTRLEPGAAAVEATAVRFDCTAVTEIPTAECQALVAFYEATGGPGWQDNSGWLVTNTPCSWSGVTCADGHVDMLGLFYNNVQGPLPATLADLARLRVLDLHNNAVSGPIPPEIGRLANLQSLDLSDNQVSGPLPSALGDLAVLQFLKLPRNQLSGPIPAELGQLAALTALDLSQNQISGEIPAALGSLTALQTMRLHDNQLAGAIPFAPGQLSDLYEIDLSFNQLAGPVPSALFEVSDHRLWGNQLDGTISAENRPQDVNFLGVAFTYDQAVADDVWPEQLPARPPEPGPGIMWAPSEHIIFTLTDDSGPQNHNPMGQYVPAEAQIHIYPTAGLNEEVQPAVDNLRQLLAEKPDPADYAAVMPEQNVAQPGLAMLPPSNAAQTFRAQATYLTFTDGEGVRYLTQLSQGPIPVNNQDLFYTFQGLTDDGAFYVAAYFPVTLPALPDTPQLSEAEYTALMADWQGYVAQTVDMLNKQPSDAYTADLAALDAVIKSLSLIGITAVATPNSSPQISLDTSGIAAGFNTETVTPDVDGPYWEVLPQYTQLTLQDYPISNHLVTPQIFIYPVEDLQAVNEGTVPIVTSLQTLLQSPQEVTPMPFLPLFNAQQVMHTNVQYLDFQDGQGLRYLTQYDQAFIPINNDELIYTYQGLTSDGRYYVAAVFPVHHPSLPPDGNVTGNEPPEFTTDFPAYIANVVASLNPQAANSFTPDLTQLDAMMSSLEIK